MIYLAFRAIYSPHNGIFQFPIRTLFSKTGEWIPKLTISKKKELEEFWRPRIHKAARRRPDRGKYYVLSMFPYPSGKLHMGHVRVYAISDAMARYRKMQGYDVIHPMGWDAFGLPAENAANEQGVPAHKWTMANIDRMKKQLINMGFGFDWDREITTCEPSYYKWTQYLFLKLWHAGLVYQKEAFVNWDPVDKTVLANEQVDEHGNSWRSGAKVEKKLLKQWFIRTSDYASKLRDSLDSLSNWEEVAKLQKSWIGDILGHWVTMDVVDSHSGDIIDHVRVFTKDKYSVFGAAFVILSSSHELFAKVKVLTTGQAAEVKCRNPFTNDMLPLFLTDGTEFLDVDCNARVGVPWICEEDARFAKDKGVLFDWGPERKKLWEDARTTNDGIFSSVLNYGADAGWITGLSSLKLKDWLISRQRYWGTPIPIIKCSACGPVPVPYESLPVILPLLDDVSSAEPTLTGLKEWVETSCPRCHNPARRETDTMDTFVDSSWYFLRYLDTGNEKEPFSREAAFSAMPVDLYIGGKEHALMHLFYARFIGHFLYDENLLPQPEPFKNLLTQGYVQGKALIDKITGKYLKPDEVENIDGKIRAKNSGNAVAEEWTKMSKSKFNGLDPDDAIQEYGIDSTRLFMLGNISPRSHRRWEPELFKGLLNWENHMWSTVHEYLKSSLLDSSADSVKPEELAKHENFLFDSRNYYLKGLNHVLDRHYTMNVAISKLQGLSSSLRKVPSEMISISEEYRKTLQQIIIMLFPFSPHFAAELWQGVRSVPKARDISEKEVWEMDWPHLDPTYHLDLVIKLCGDEVDAVKMPRPDFDILNKENSLKIAMESPKLQHFARGLALKGVYFTFYPDYEAIIDLVIPDAAKIRDREKAQKKAKKNASEQKQVDSI